MFEMWMPVKAKNEGHPQFGRGAGTIRQIVTRDDKNQPLTVLVNWDSDNTYTGEDVADLSLLS
jgi:hypothetical protein